MNKDISDQLSWKEFLKQSKKNIKVKTVEPFNRLIAHSKNFFLISGYGAFTLGYQIIITKDFIPSFGLVEEENLEELSFIIKIAKESIKDKFDRKSVTFEHGMCACIGGLDRAHLHIMSIHKETTKTTLKNSIDKTLYDRKAGIKYIKFKNYKLENIHDINQFIESSKNNKNLDFKIEGKILKADDIKDLPSEEWPKVTLPHINKGGHYVYFKSEFDDSSFLTTHNFQTQFGRQVVFENEKILDKSFKKKIEYINKNNQFLEIWRWQNCMFEENIIKTINSSKKTLKKLENKYQKEYKNFKIEVI